MKPSSSRYKTITAFAMAITMGCRSTGTEQTALRDAATAPSTAQALSLADPNDPGPNLPPIGRSAFDYLIGGDAIPFPFPKLIEVINKEVAVQKSPDSDNPYGAKLIGSLVGFSRSLQRRTTSPSTPRVLLAVDNESDPQMSKRGLLLRDRLFLGFSEKAKRIEVISYNEAAARFEFQEVLDYEPGKIPKVVYSKRVLCTSCHQSHGPLFMIEPWTETNGAIESPVPRMIFEAHEGAASYHGVPITQAKYPGDDDEDPENPTISAQQQAKLLANVDNNRFEAAVHRGSILKLFDYTWRTLCGRTEGGGAECRGKLLELGILMKGDWSTSVNQDFAQLSASLRQRLSAEGHTRATIPDGLTLNPLDPELFPIVTGLAPSSDAVAPLNPDAASEVTQRLSIFLPVFSEPLTRQQLLVAIKSEGEPDALRELVQIPGLDLGATRMRVLEKAANKAVPKLRTAIASLIAAAKNDPKAVLGDGPYRAGAIYRELVAALGGPAPKHCCEAGAPVPPLAEESSAEGAAISMPMKLLDHYCASCHIAGPYPFMEGSTEAKRWVAITPIADRLIRSLKWESSPLKPMPQGPKKQELQGKQADRDVILLELQKRFPQ